MPIMKWNNTYLLGIEEFDEHHKHLVALLNKTYEEYKSNAPPSALETIIDELVDYASYHFAAEEAWMTKYSYPKYAVHKKEHDNFAEKVAVFQKGLNAGEVSLNADLFSFLIEWLISHILESDANLGRYNLSISK